MTTAIEVGSGVLSVDGAPVPTRLPVSEAVATDGRLIVLYDRDANPRPWGTFPNLACVDEAGHEVWVADTATTTTGDCYTHIDAVDPLRAYAFSGYVCTIDTATGAVIDRAFTK
jgi:hypothetical protein